MDTCVPLRTQPSWQQRTEPEFGYNWCVAFLELHPQCRPSPKGIPACMAKLCFGPGNKSRLLGQIARLTVRWESGSLISSIIVCVYCTEQSVFSLQLTIQMGQQSASSIIQWLFARSFAGICLWNDNRWLQTRLPIHTQFQNNWVSCRYSLKMQNHASQFCDANSLT